jgi:hypothetical protein
MTSQPGMLSSYFHALIILVLFWFKGPGAYEYLPELPLLEISFRSSSSGQTWPDSTVTYLTAAAIAHLWFKRLASEPNSTYLL